MINNKNNSVKIVFFHPYFSDGGVERTNIGLAQGLIQHGYDVAFVTIMPTQHFLEEVHLLGIQWVVLPAKSTLAAQPAFARWIRGQKSSKQTMVVISCQYYVNLACLMFRPFWGRGVLHILSERNHLDEFLIHRSFKHFLISKMVRFFYHYADTVIANSQELAKDLSKTIGRSVSVVYNPTINDRLYRLAEEQVSETWFHGDDRPTIIAVGRLTLQKDFATLIRAFSIVRNVHNARLIILGEGPERENLEKMATKLGVSEDILMLGFVSNPYKFMKRSDLFVLSSAYEGLPNALIEALALKLPVISTNCRSGPAEILKNGKTGQLVGVGDATALAKAISNVLTDFALGNIIVNSADQSLKRFTHESAGAQLNSLLKKTLMNMRNSNS